MENFYSETGTRDHWQLIQKIALETFTETFRHLNKKENFDSYIAKAFTETNTKKELHNPHSYFYLFYENEALAGYLKLNEFDAQTEAEGDDSLEIERIYLYRKFKGKGYGRKMMVKAIQVAREKNKQRVWLGVWEKNTTAISFYRKAGFKEFSHHIFTIGDDDQLDLLMELELA